MIRLLTRSLSHNVSQSQLRRCQTTGTGHSQEKVASIASRLITEANDHAVRELPKEFTQLVGRGLKEARDKNLQSALDLLQRSITYLTNTPAHHEQLDAVKSYIEEIKTKMKFLDGVEGSTPEDRFVKAVYDGISCGNLPLRAKEIRSR